MVELATAFKTVLERQLQRHLTGELSEPSPELIEQCSSAPTHNIFAEQTLGMADMAVRRAPSGSTHYIESKVYKNYIFKTNKYFLKYKYF